VLLTIDIGNTHVALGLFDGRALAHHWRLGTQLQSTSDELAATLMSLFQLHAVEREKIDSSIVSCVVPPLLPIFERTVRKLVGRDPLVVGPGMRSGIPIRVDNPREVGADRIVNAVAALDMLGGGPAISIDFGTATSFDCISANGEFIGGAIFPGVVLSLEALVARASRLSSVEIERPPSVIGRNTTHNLQSGMLYGYAGMVDTMVERIRGELGEQAGVIATGGLAHLIAMESESIERVEPFLTLEGLRLIYERNMGTARPAPRQLEEST
jgi:type III pantothenate kinase